MADPGELDVSCLEFHGAASLLPEVFCQECPHPFHRELMCCFVERHRRVLDLTTAVPVRR